MATWGRIKGYGRVDMTSIDNWVGTQGYWCEIGSEVAVAKVLRGQAHPDVGGVGLWAPTCSKVEIHKYGLSATKSLLIGRYETRRIPGHGRLFRSPYQTSEHRKTDLFGHIIEGLEPPLLNGSANPNAGLEWRTIRGSANIPLMRAHYRLDTAYVSGDTKLTQSGGFDALIDHINDTSVPRFLGPARYTLRYEGYTLQSIGAFDLIYVSHLFDYNAYGWNNWIRSELGGEFVSRVPVLDADKNPILDDDGNIVTRDLKYYKPAQKVKSSTIQLDTSGDRVVVNTYEDTPAEARSIYPMASFTDFDRMIIW